MLPDDRAPYGPREAAALAREYARSPKPDRRRPQRRQRLRLLARQAQAAWRAWKAAGEARG